MNGINIGIDLGGTSIKTGVVNDEYKIIGRSAVKTNLPRSENEIVNSIIESIELACTDANITLQDVNNIGIGTPGAVDVKSGTVLFSSNLGFKNTPLAPLLSEKLGKPVFAENDANAAAYGETIAGAGVGFRDGDVAVITLGTGVGCGIIVNGGIFYGSAFCGGEIGHMVIEYNGLPCPCGRKGCFESYCSATALIQATKKAMEADKNSLLWTVQSSLDKVDGKTAFDGMRLNDDTAKKVVDDFIGYLGCGLVNIINIIQPELILIGGGVCKEGDTLIKPLREYIKRESYGSGFTKLVKLDTAKLGNDAGIIGAACLYKL